MEGVKKGDIEIGIEIEHIVLRNDVLKIHLQKSEKSCTLFCIIYKDGVK